MMKHDTCTKRHYDALHVRMRTSHRPTVTSRARQDSTSNDAFKRASRDLQTDRQIDWQTNGQTERHAERLRDRQRTNSIRQYEQNGHNSHDAVSRSPINVFVSLSDNIQSFDHTQSRQNRLTLPKNGRVVAREPGNMAVSDEVRKNIYVLQFTAG